MSKRNAALLGCDFVTTFSGKYVWEVGKEFGMADFHGLSLFMAGSFTPRDPSYRNVILTDRVFLQEIDSKRGVANHILAKIDHQAHLFDVIAQIEAIPFPVKVRAASAQMALDKAVEDLDDMLEYAKFVIIFMSIIMLLCVGNAISMSTHDRTQEMGTLRSIGFERPHIISLILWESVLLSLLGGLLGCGAAYLILHFAGHQLAASGVTIAISMRPGIALLGLAASLCIGFMGGILPAVRTSRLNIVKALKRME